jgi:hypothetical protein
MNDDGLHYNISKLDGYDRDLNFIISPRSDGKTTQVLGKVARNWLKDKSPTILICRNNVDITEQYVDTTLDIIDDVAGHALGSKHPKISDKGASVLDCAIDKEVFLRFVSLSQKLRNLKGVYLKNLGLVIFDEFIINTRLGEKYLTDEAFKFQEAYTTYRRECGRARLKAYFMGNAYSLYNPHLINLGIDCSQLRKPGIIAGPNYAVERHFLDPRLKELLKKQNPFFQDEDSIYAKYALDGMPINDSNIRLMEKCPQGYVLQFAFSIDGKILAAYEAPDWDAELRYWIGFSDGIGSRRNIFAFDFKDLIEHSRLIGPNERNALSRLRTAIRNRNCAFEGLECDYAIEEIFNQL